jgi:tetratricopeptide (TPR) repeat protein
MNRTIKTFMPFLMLIIALLFFQVSADAANPREELQQMVEQLQQSPSDAALREKIVRHAIGMKPAPAVPEEARKYFTKANVMQEAAKDAQGLGLAVNAYNQALLIAPWWSDAYYNFSIALERSSRFDEAIGALKLYLLTNSNASDARAVQDKIYAIEAKKEMAQAEKAIREEKKRKETDFSGIWVQDPVETCWRYRFAVNGNKLVITSFCPNQEAELVGWATLNGRAFEGKMNTAPDKYGASACPGSIKGVIDEDNRKIEISFPSCNGGRYGYNLVHE